jgi:hypothetical protein
MKNRNNLVPVGTADYLLKKAEYLDKRRAYRQTKTIGAINLESLYEPKQLDDQGKQYYF